MISLGIGGKIKNNHHDDVMMIMTSQDEWRSAYAPKSGLFLENKSGRQAVAPEVRFKHAINEVRA